MSAIGATSGALLISGATLLVSLFAAATIYSQINSIWSELDAEMNNFKVWTLLPVAFTYLSTWRMVLRIGSGQNNEYSIVHKSKNRIFGKDRALEPHRNVEGTITVIRLSEILL